MPRGLPASAVLTAKGFEKRDKIANFLILPRKELNYYDGENSIKKVEIEGLMNGVTPLPAQVVDLREAVNVIDAATELWGLRPALCAGKSCKEKMRYLTQRLCEKARQMRIYTATGWYEQRGKRFYLHAGGAIGAPSVTADLTDNGTTGELAKYALPDETVVPDYQLALQFLDIAAAKIVYPLIGAIALAPALDLLREAGVFVNFLPFLCGCTGSGKSTLALIAQSFFGQFRTTADFPANFKMTANCVEKLSFILKDTLMVVDDYYPGDSQAEQKRLADFANKLARGYGDGAARKRMRQDGKTLHAGYSPRGLALLTGEMRPEISEGGQARFFFIDVARDKVDYFGKLTALNNRRGELPAIMRAYISWLLENRARLVGEIRQYDEYYLAFFGSEHSGRQSNAARFLITGAFLWFEFLRAVGALTQIEVNAHLANAEQALKEMLAQNSSLLDDEKPAQKFLTTLREMLATDEVELQQVTALPQFKSDRVAGWQDSEYLYLLPAKVFSAVQRRLRDSCGEIRMRPAVVWRDLAALGMIEYSEKRQRFTKPARIEGRLQETLHVIRERAGM